MNATDTKLKIEENKKKLVSCIQQLDIQKATLISLIKPFVKEENNKTVIKTVSQCGEKTQTIGMISLKELKERTNKLYQNSDEIMNEILTQESFWLHERLKDSDSKTILEYCENGFEKAMRQIKQAVRQCLGYSGALLEEYGYIQIFETQSFYNNTIPGWYKHGDKIFRGDELILPPNINQQINEYSRMLMSLHIAISEKEQLEEKLKEQEIKDLWDQL